MAIYGIVGTQEAVDRYCDRVAGTATKSPALVKLGKVMGPGKGKELVIAFSAEGYGCASDHGVHAVLSGEIANRGELLALVGSAAHASFSDAELFAAMFQKYGENCLKLINGQLCAAVWNVQCSSLSLFLDRVGGIKTLYYAAAPDGFIFGSNLISVVASSSVRREINNVAVQQLFATGFILPPVTLIKGVSKISPGESVVYASNGSITRNIVDRVVFDSSSRETRTADDLGKKLISALKLRSLEPETGFLLSGGIDSSTLVALTAQGLNRKVNTYTAAFPGSPLDESPYAECVARENGCPNESIVLSNSDALDDLPEIVWHLGEPFLDFSVIPTFHLFRNISTQTPYIVSGDGPDHLFGRYYPLVAKRYVASRYPLGVNVLAALHVSFADKIQKAGRVSLAEAYRGLFAIPTWGVSHTETMLGLLTKQEVLAEERHPYLESLAIPEQNDFCGCFDSIAALDFYLDGSFGVFAKVGRMADACSLTIREPYLDREVVDFIAKLPLAQKQSGTLLHLLASKSKAKYLLKYGLASKILPAKVIHKAKGGFTPPLNAWLKDTVCTVPALRLLCNTLKSLGIMNLDVVDEILRQHREASRDWSRVIFMILSFDLWVRLFIESDLMIFPGWKLHQLYDTTL